MIKKRKMNLGASIRGVGYHACAWRDPDVPSDGGIRFEHFLGMIKTLERGLFDMAFFADYLGMGTENVPHGVLGRAHVGADLEPITLLSALSQFTHHIGLVATASTTFQHPYLLARAFSSLDHLSNGRAGWNVVTSSQDMEAVNFGEDSILDKNSRYERAQEALQVVFGLWDSWEEDAFVSSKKTGVFFDHRKMHPINHQGKYFKVRGPLTSPRTPQGRPIIIQAGASSDGMDLAAARADVVYTAQDDLEDGRKFYSSLKARVVKHGREPDELKIMPGIMPIIGESENEAQEKLHRMHEEIDELVGLGWLRTYFGDLSGYPVDGPVPELRTDKPFQSRGELILRTAKRNNWSIRQLYQSTLMGNAHRVVTGTPQQIADTMEEWFEAGAADGFNIVPAKTPKGVNEFVAQIVPELQRRGLFRTSYEGSTFRANLGLPEIRSRKSRSCTA